MTDDYDWGIPVIESPYLPEGTFIIGALDGLGSRSWNEPFTISDPLWEPPASWRGQTYANERAIAHDHLAGLLDGLCSRWGIDTDVWRVPRTQLTMDAIRRTNRITYALEERLAMTIRRPSEFVITAL